MAELKQIERSRTPASGRARAATVALAALALLSTVAACTARPSSNVGGSAAGGWETVSPAPRSNPRTGEASPTTRTTSPGTTRLTEGSGTAPAATGATPTRPDPNATTRTTAVAPPSSTPRSPETTISVTSQPAFSPTPQHPTRVTLTPSIRPDGKTTMVFPPFYGDLVSTSPSATVWAPSGMPPQPAAAASSAASAFVGLIDARSRLYINRKLDQPTELLKVATPAVADELLGDIKQLPASYKISGYTQVQMHIVSASAAQVGLHACLDDSGVHWVDTATGNRIDWQYRNGTWRLAVDAVVTPGAGPDRWLVSTLDIPGETC